MNKSKLSTEPYKGVRDFYPADMAVQRYLFKVWSETAESFGYERYDASVLEPTELYENKTSQEIVGEQTYTFTDRGDRSVTLRTEMTPTVARMVAGRRKELGFPLRWYSIPNLFRYERPQRGRLREHWQFNCDIFGSHDLAADVEVIRMAAAVLENFGVAPEQFTIRLNDRSEMTEKYHSLNITNDDLIAELTRLNDRKDKLPDQQYRQELSGLLPKTEQVEAVIKLLEDKSGSNPVSQALAELGFNNVVVDRSLARGFDYYTGTVFEFFDASGQNKRSLLGGGRYDNLTGLFGGEPIPGVGFGFGDVALRDFLTDLRLIPDLKTGPNLVVIPTDPSLTLKAFSVADTARTHGINTSVDFSNRAVGKKIEAADKRGAESVLVFGPDELSSGHFTLKKLADKSELSGSLTELFST